METIIGIVAAFILVFFGIVVTIDGGFAVNLGSIGNFFDIQSIIIVVFGVIATLVASYPISMVKGIPGHMKTIIAGNKHNPNEYIEQIVECAEIARKNGLLALEEHANNMEDAFMKDSLLLIVDAIDADKVRSMLEGDLGYMSARHEQAIGFYDRGAALSPAFGMLGTLIGLINMLAGLDLNSADGTSSLTSGMAVALITTFYGSLMANVIFTPIASKLQAVNEAEVLCKEIVIEGILSIQSGENPKFIREKLVSFLSEHEKENVLGEE